VKRKLITVLKKPLTIVLPNEKYPLRLPGWIVCFAGLVMVSAPIGGSLSSMEVFLSLFLGIAILVAGTLVLLWRCTP